MSIPFYNQVISRLYALSSSTDSGVSGYWAGYLTSPAAAFGEQASLMQVWSDAGGVYLFLKETPTDAGLFAAGLEGILPQLSPTGWLRFIWIFNPNDTPAYWQTQLLDALPVAEASGSWSVIRDARFYLGSYAVAINGGTSLDLSETAGAEGVLLAAKPINLVSPDGLYPAQDGEGAIPFAGHAIGSVTFGISLDNGAGTADDMERLGIMFRYGAENPDSPVGAVRTIDMPLLKQKDATVISLIVSYDPLHPLDADRSNLSFFPASSSPSALDCAMVTNLGYATLLTPLDAAKPLWGARFAFCRTPLFNTDSDIGASYDYHLTPDGAFQLTCLTPEQVTAGFLVNTGSAIADRLMLGISGAEYVALPAASGMIVLFSAGKPAYAPSPVRENTLMKTERSLLSNLATTGYLAILPAHSGDTGLSYYAQPLQAPLYNAAGTLGAGFLEFLEMPAATLPSYQPSDSVPPVVMPVGVYSRITTAAIDAARLLESAALAPARRAVIGLPSGDPVALVGLDTLQDMPMAVTPQGLVALLSEDKQQWAGVLIANMLESAHQRLTLTAVQPVLQSALQSNQLFFVVSNVDTFMQGSSVSYQLTAENALRLMANTGVPEAVAINVKNALAALQPPYPLFPTEPPFNAAVSAAAGDSLAQVQAAAGLLQADIDGWNFQLSPRAWRKDENTPTLMVFKYCNRSLADLASDPASWGWKEAAMDSAGSINPTLTVLNGILAAAGLRAIDPDIPETDAYVRFYREVADNPLWNGVIFFNAPVDFTQMPQPLQFMAAGVDTAKFYAHHIGFSVTPFSSGGNAVDLGQTAAFGLIDYNDPEDLVASTTIPFGFKTLQMRVMFTNARLADFSAQVELMVNRLFGSWLMKNQQSRGNNLILDGSYQRLGGLPSYSFALMGENLFLTENAALLSVEVTNARLETSSTAEDGQLTSRFVLSGRLRFVLIESFDLFSYGPDADEDGYIRFDGLAIAVSFPLATPSDQSFTIAEAAIAFDTSTGNSKARKTSLVENFPLQLLQLVASPNIAAEGELPKGQSPADLGFTSISAPLDQTPMTAPWYGLAFNLDLGTLGALSGAVGLKVTLLAAWMQGVPQGEIPPAFLGLKLADSKAIGGSLPLQGVLKLGFRSFQFETYQAPDPLQPGKTVLAYLLRMRRFALSVLVWSFPPGNADLLLFGAPGNPKASLGWYAAYSKEEEAKKADRETGRIAAEAQSPPLLPDKQARRRKSGRRTPPIN